MADEFQFDVFLSHSAKDKALVRPLAERLQVAVRKHLKVWFDEWECPSPVGAGEGGRRPGEGRGVKADSIPAKIEAGLEHSNFGFRISDFGFAKSGMSAHAFGSDWAQLEVGTCGRGNLPFRDTLSQERRFTAIHHSAFFLLPFSSGSLAQFPGPKRTWVVIDWSRWN